MDTRVIFALSTLHWLGDRKPPAGGMRSRVQHEFRAPDPMNTGVEMSAEEFEMHVADALDEFRRSWLL